MRHTTVVLLKTVAGSGRTFSFSIFNGDLVSGLSRVIIVRYNSYLVYNTVEPPFATTSRKRPPLISDHVSKLITIRFDKHWQKGLVSAITIFITKTAEKPYPLGPDIPI